MDRSEPIPDEVLVTWAHDAGFRRGGPIDDIVDCAESLARELLACREALRRLCDEDLRSADPDLGALYDAQTAARSLLPPPAKEPAK